MNQSTQKLVVSFAAGLISMILVSGLVYRWVNQPPKPPRGTPLVRALYRAIGMPLPPNKAPDYFDDPAVSNFCEFIEIGDLEAVERIAQSDVDINYVGKDGLTPLTWAFLHRHPQMYLSLLEYGADPNIAVSDDIQLYLAALQAGDSFLLGVAKSGDFYTLWQILPYAKDIHQQDARGHGILPYYIGSLFLHGSNSTPEEFLDDLDKFLRHGVDIDAQSRSGDTPLHLAIDQYLPFAIPLLQRGADPMIPNGKGETAIDRFLSAASKRRISDTETEVFEILQEQGYFDEGLTLAEAIRERQPDRRRQGTRRF